MVDTCRRSGLAGIYRAPRNLDQIGADSVSKHDFSIMATILLAELAHRTVTETIPASITKNITTDTEIYIYIKYKYIKCTCYI